jgi:predicted MFS family arabinose efflux permease
MSLAVVLAALWLSGRLGIEAILLVAFATGLAQSQSAPTYQAVLTSVVPKDHIPNAVALNSLQFNLSRAVGPVIAGALLVRGGTTACFVVNALSFVAVIVAIWHITIPAHAAAPTETLARSLGTGLRHVMNSPVLSTLTLLGGVGSFLGYPLITYLPVFAGDVLHTGVTGYSALLTSYGCGAIIGAVTTAHRGNRPGRGKRMLLAMMVYGVVTAGAMACRSQQAAMALLVLSGISMVTAFSTLNSLVQENAPDALKGRILSIYGLAFRGGLPLGALVAGVLVRPLGTPLVIGGFSVLVALLAAITLASNQRVRAL